MSGGPDELAARKALLVAQSALYRAQLGAAALQMRARPATLPIASLLMLFAGRSKAASWIGTAGTVLSIARMAVTVLGLFRGK